MSILFLTHAYADTAHGGVAEFLHYLPLNLREQHIDSFIYTKSAQKHSHDLIGPEILPNEVQRYSGPFFKPGLFSSKKTLRAILRLCQEKNIQLIHAQGTYRAGCMALEIQKLTGIPYVVTSHSDILELNSERMRRNTVKRRCQNVLRNASYVTHLTPMMEAASKQLCDTRHKNKIIHNGIDVDVWQDYQNAALENYMLTIGRLEPEKGFNLLLDAYVDLYQQGVRTSLVIAGTGSAESQLIEQAKLSGIPVITNHHDQEIPGGNIIFTGYVREKEKKSLFARSRFILFPTQPHLWEEAFGIVQLEAMAAGKTIIASNTQATHYLCSLGMQAEVVPAEDRSAWLQAMKMLLEAPEKCYQMGVANRASAQQFAWQRIASEYAEVYTEVMRGKKQ
jgi:glycosyltransferase involved in cell wall biosynthesis